MDDNDEMTEYGGWIVFVGILIGCIVLGLAVVKVRNELLMTRAYDRQAVALERAATALERIAGESWYRGMVARGTVPAPFVPEP